MCSSDLSRPHRPPQTPQTPSGPTHLKRTPFSTCQALGAGCCRCVSPAAASPPPLLVTYGAPRLARTPADPLFPPPPSPPYLSRARRGPHGRLLPARRRHFVFSSRESGRGEGAARCGRGHAWCLYAAGGAAPRGRGLSEGAWFPQGSVVSARGVAYVRCLCEGRGLSEGAEFTRGGGVSAKGRGLRESDVYARGRGLSGAVVSARGRGFKRGGVAYVKSLSTRGGVA